MAAGAELDVFLEGAAATIVAFAAAADGDAAVGREVGTWAWQLLGYTARVQLALEAVRQSRLP
jgi:hypothetical protein